MTHTSTAVVFPMSAASANATSTAEELRPRPGQPRQDAAGLAHARASTSIPVLLPGARMDIKHVYLVDAAEPPAEPAQAEPAQAEPATEVCVLTIKARACDFDTKVIERVRGK